MICLRDGVGNRFVYTWALEILTEFLALSTRKPANIPTSFANTCLVADDYETLDNDGISQGAVKYVKYSRRVGATFANIPNRVCIYTYDSLETSQFPKREVEILILFSSLGKYYSKIIRIIYGINDETYIKWISFKRVTSDFEYSFENIWRIFYNFERRSNSY